MVHLPSQQRDHLRRICSAANGAMHDGIVVASHKDRQRFWDHWVKHCQQLGMDPRLAGCSRNQRLTALVTFAQRVREGAYSTRTSVRMQTVQLALRAVGQTFKLDGDANPCYQLGQQVFLLPIKRLLAGYKRKDPPPGQKLAILLTVIHHIMAQAIKRPTV